jgi:heterodisulfide reductase subunit B/Pyruvate/2-oxoacid:ferredoxin oxidoreductase delta subunit
MVEIPEGIKKLMSECIGCGQCETVCPSFAEGGCDPRAVMQGEDGNIRQCIGCGRCSRICPNTDPWNVMMAVRCAALGLKPSKVYDETGLTMRRLQSPSREESDLLLDGEDVRLMSGCTVEALIPFLKTASAVSLRALGIGCSALPDGSCCTYPVHFRAWSDEERDSKKKEISSTAGGMPIVTICPGCATELSQSGADARHVIHLFHDNLDKIRALHGVRMKVAIQPGCHEHEFGGELEEVIRACGAEPIGNRTGCCGKNVKGIADAIMAKRESDMEGADAVIVACPFCFNVYDAYPDGVPVMHITELVALAAGDSRTLGYHKIPPKDAL